MKRSGLTEFEIEEKGLRLRICRSPNGNGNGNLAVVQAAPTYPGAVPPVLSPQPETPSSPSSESKAEEADKENLHFIKSPMVGTFYRSPSPESPPFVNEGDTIEQETTVCIIEAMKVMNEIPADIAGEIVQILLQNGESVEYGQPLFEVKKT